MKPPTIVLRLSFCGLESWRVLLRPKTKAMAAIMDTPAATPMAIPAVSPVVNPLFAGDGGAAGSDVGALVCDVSTVDEILDVADVANAEAQLAGDSFYLSH
jgi:hypothetical protein